jgi:hypothetical protein
MGLAEGVEIDDGDDEKSANVQDIVKALDAVSISLLILAGLYSCCIRSTRRLWFFKHLKLKSSISWFQSLLSNGSRLVPLRLGG